MRFFLPGWILRPLLGLFRTRARQGWLARRMRPLLRTGHILHDRVPHQAGFMQLRWISHGQTDRHRVVIYLRGDKPVPEALHLDMAARLSEATGARVMMPDTEYNTPADVLTAYHSLLSRGYAPERIGILAAHEGAGRAFAALASAAEKERPLPAAIVSLSGRFALEAPLANPFPPVYLLCHRVGEERAEAAALTDRLEQTGVDIRLEIWQGVPGAWPLYAAILKDGQETLNRISTFFNRHMEQGPSVRK